MGGKASGVLARGERDRLDGAGAGDRAPRTPGEPASGAREPVCQARGAPAEYFGGMDLRIREEDGTLTDIMQADQTVYLRPREARLPGASHMIVGEHDFPDVVLEVDNTTDVRRGKLLAYEDWEFPEIWVETPDLASPSRPRSSVRGSRSGFWKKAGIGSRRRVERFPVGGRRKSTGR